MVSNIFGPAHAFVTLKYDSRCVQVLRCIAEPTRNTPTQTNSPSFDVLFFLGEKVSFVVRPLHGRLQKPLKTLDSNSRRSPRGRTEKCTSKHIAGDPVSHHATPSCAHLRMLRVSGR